MKKFTKIVCIAIVSLLLFNVAVSCKKNAGGGSSNLGGSELARGYEYKKQASELFQFYSSDAFFDAFLNEYMERHLRYNKNAIGSLLLGGGNSIWKEWESMAVMFMNTTPLGYDPKATIKNWVQSIYQDKYGYIWMDDGTDSTSWGQSWEFPNSSDSFGQNNSYEFSNKSTDKWTAVSDNGIAGISGSGFYKVSGDNIKSVTYETTAGITKMAQTFHAPFVILKLNLLDENQMGYTDHLKDVKISWKTTGDANYTTAKQVSYNDFSTTTYDKFPSSASIVFPMGEHPEWNDDKTVTAMKIEFEFKTGINAEVALDSVSLAYDGRQINNNGVFINAAANYFEYTQDAEFLKENIDKLRKAMQFYLTYCGGESGLVNTKNFTGHDGTDNMDYMSSKDVPKAGTGSGIGDGYWDCLSYPQTSSYCNNLYYSALNSMKYLEDMVIAAGADSGNTVSVKTADMKSSQSYQQNSEKLGALIAKCSTAYNTAFWDDSVGRYHLGISAKGEKVDYGFTLYNEEAVLYGLADDDKATKIMSWINGERNVEGDDSQGSNIYFYKFAPRWTTKNNKYQFWFQFNGQAGSYKWKNQIQNGGTAIHDAYYDIAATAKSGGTEKAFAKVKNIQAWFEDVKKAGGTGSSFYETYYKKEFDGTGPYKLQGSKGAGAIGLDSEFLEAAILYTAIPDTFFGLGSSQYKTLDIAPKLPQSLTFWKMENLTFGKAMYDLSIGTNFVQINSISGDKTDLRVKVTLPKPSGAFQVRQHNKILSADVDYLVVGNEVIINAPMINGRIQILPL